MSELLQNGTVVSFMLTAVMALLGWLLTLAVRKFGSNKILGEVLDAIRVGMNEVYNNVILPKLERARAKGSEGDEKITAAERNDLLREVWIHLMDNLKGPALAFVKEKGFAWVSAKVEDILLGIKAKSAEAAPAPVVIVGPQDPQAPQAPQV